MQIRDARDLAGLDYGRGGGLVTVVVQHARTGEVLMLAHANRDALERTLASGDMWFWSRSRASLWRKGETSGNSQRLVALHADCDRDAVLALVEPHGPSCHTGARTCFEAAPLLPALAGLIAERARAAPEGSYTARLMTDTNLRLKKLGEEAVELAVACVLGDPRQVADEAADVVYHTLVACAARGVGLDAVLDVLATRRSAPGPPEKDPVDALPDDPAQDSDRE